MIFRRLLPGAGIALAATVLLLAGLFQWMSTSPLQPGQTSHAPIEWTVAKASHSAPLTEITIISWNIAYGYGVGSDGVGYEPHPMQEYDHRIQRMADLLVEHNADIVLLQEIDFNSDRSGNKDQLADLSRLTGLPWGARATSWKTRYIPFPYWPPEKQFGRVDSGGAVLSRFPIVGNQVTLHPKPLHQPWWYQAFYLYRYSQFVAIDIDGTRYVVGNNHLEAFDADNRQQQATKLKTLLESRSSPLLAWGGDLNTVPRSASQKSRFPIYTDDDYEVDETLPILSSITGYSEVVSETAYNADEQRWFTFPGHNPERRLDYLFVSRDARVVSRQVVRTGDLSDHLPLVVRIRLPKSKPDTP